MDLALDISALKKKAIHIQISGSKSETNRLLLLQALYPEINIENASNSDDSEVMMQILKISNTAELPALDVHHAGTAMRFLTAFFAIQEGNEVVLTGSSRMKERPIQILVEALNQLGADISYVENQGFPPLRIRGRKLSNHKVILPANVSSQYISALLLIAPKLDSGLELTLEGEITSLPYIKMTLGLLEDLGVITDFHNNTIRIQSQTDISKVDFQVESDWSSASYWYSIVALSEIGTQISLSNYKQNSFQGDAALSSIYKDFGVKTTFENNSIVLKKDTHPSVNTVDYNLNNSPDIAQTIAVTCFGMGMGCQLTGLHTLKIKETDRLLALQKELTKLGAIVEITEEALFLAPNVQINDGCAIKTYQDHRMAMAFAPLALKTNLIIEEADVVSKSYPDFWTDLKHVGFVFSEI